MERIPINKIRALLNENKKLLEENTKHKHQTNYDVKLMENKLEYDKILLEILTLAVYEHANKKLSKDDKAFLNEIVNEIFENAVKIYEELDLLPIIKGVGSIEINENISNVELADKFAKLIKEEYDMLIEKANRTFEKINKDKERCKRLKQRAKRRLLKQKCGKKNLDEAIEYALTGEVLTELVNKFIFPSLNYKLVFENNFENGFDEFDRELLEDLVDNYNMKVNEFVDFLLDKVYD